MSPNKLTIAVIGAGAMGSLFGARLSKTAEVVLIDPWREHVAAIAQHGLQVEALDGERSTFPLTALPEEGDLQLRVDVAIIFTKSAATLAAANLAEKVLAPHGFVLTLQNGLGNLEVIQQVVGKSRAVAGVTAHGATLVGPGIVRHAGKGPTHISNPHAGLAGFDQLIKALGKAGFEASLADDLDGLIWGKLIINVGINALTAILRVPNGVIARDGCGGSIMRAVVEEAVLVARALKVDLPYDDPVEQVRETCRLTAANRASMLQDMLRGAPTEIDMINGAIVRIGAALGIPTPYNHLLTDLIKALENTHAERIGVPSEGA